jgi:hypothetical protein
MPHVADVVLRGTFDAAHERRYTHVPFDVPTGVRTLHVSYEYTDRIDSDPRLGGGNTLDIGLFDPRGIAPSSPGFRGCSGSNKLAFSVSETWATPPYLAGGIQPGRWHVLLGPYKVGPNGCEYQIDITFDAQPSVGETGAKVVSARKNRLALAAEPGWLRGDLHCHTLHSDGDSWPAEMLDEAIRRGLDFLGVTDHNGVAHHPDYAGVQGADLPILLPGVEVTTYRGHWNAWGVRTWYDFRDPTPEGVSRAIGDALRDGALVSVNHPKPFGPPWEYPTATGYHAIEVWNGHWQAANGLALAWWEQHLRAGQRIVALGGSDTHELKRADTHAWYGGRLGSPTTWAYLESPADPSAESVLHALRAGRAFISRDPSGPQLYLSSEADTLRVRAVDAPGAALLLISDAGVEFATPISTDDSTHNVRCPSTWTYLRCQLIDEQGNLLALTNPVFEPGRPRL